MRMLIDSGFEMADESFCGKVNPLVQFFCESCTPYIFENFYNFSINPGFQSYFIVGVYENFIT